MPQSLKTPSGDTPSNYSFDLLRRINSNSSNSDHNKPGLALSTSTRSSTRSSNRSTQPQPAHAQKRSSAPATDLVSDLIRGKEIDEFRFKHLGDRSSMIATYNNTSKQRTQYYEEQFQYKRNANSSVRERVQRESPVIAELRTNVIIKDEFTLVTDLSYHLAARYTRPDSAIMVKIDHSACLALGGTFDPCYILTLTTVPSQMGPAMNKRNATLIQSFMADILSVPPERGIVKFSPIPEENFAVNGATMLGEIERQEKQQSNDSGSTVRRVLSNGRKSMPTFKKSLPKIPAEKDEPQSVHAKTTETKADSNHVNGIANGASDSERSTNTPPTPPVAVLSPAGVYELPTVEMGEKTRPSTSHIHTASTGSNGLRMNGISDADLQSPNAANGRPRTFSGAAISKLSSTTQDKRTSGAAPAPPPIRHSRPPPSFLKLDPAKAKSKARPTTPKSSTTALPPMEDKPRPRDSYVDGVMSTPATAKERGKEPTILEKSSQESGGKHEPTANTAKRRSTISSSTTKTTSPPPIPETSETKSMKSMKVGKRKSFLSAFRRSTAAN
ncbi:Hypothetical predicted protein [Lecanosticta acicola]|uniref:L-dopachrome isomerase n=1 Tax=Lecanosticta acicola TaxID=111012 RepID=A0AAI8YRY1_9PEZI|nr:Hypothetical predicted protein [Lecanosticta acicola]